MAVRLFGIPARSQTGSARTASTPKTKIEGVMRIIRILSVGVILLLFVPLARNEDESRRDGNWWSRMDYPAKFFYTTGFFDGMELGHKISSWSLLESKQKATASNVWESYYSYRDKYFTNVSNVQLLQGVDKFYSDFRNRRIAIDDAIWIVVRQVNGMSDEDAEKLMENFRKHAGN
jgi:hypothetical protein